MTAFKQIFLEVKQGGIMSKRRRHTHAPAGNEAKLVSVITIVTIDDGDTPFVAREKFRGGEEVDGVKVSWIGRGFREDFLDMEENITQKVPKTVRVHKLGVNALDLTICTELGDARRTMLFHLWGLLKKQGMGQEGLLFGDGCCYTTNIAYVCKKNGSPRTVHIRWDFEDDGWLIDSCHISDPHRQIAGTGVISL